MINWETNRKGERYVFCTCGRTIWEKEMKCSKGHAADYKHIVRKRKKRFSGFSPLREKTGEYQ